MDGYEPQIAPRGRSRFVEANGIRHHILEYPGSRRALLILPGITSPAITWEFVSEELARRGHHVYVLDIRGRGRSDAPATGYLLEDYADDVTGVIDALGVPQPSVLGHSMGARIAAAFGARPGTKVGPLIIVDPPLSGPGRAPYPTSLQSFRDQLHEAYAGTTADAVRRHFPNWSEEDLELRADWLPTCAEVAIVESHRSFETEDFFARWAALAAPVLFVYGEESPMVTADGARDVRDANPGAQVVSIKGAGHMIPWDNLDDFLTVVDGFLTESDGGGA